LGRGSLSEPDLLQLARQGRSLCGLGTAGAFRSGASGRVQIAAVYPRGAMGRGRPNRRRPWREALPGIQHADAHPQKAGSDGLHPAAAYSGRRAAGRVTLTPAGRKLSLEGIGSELFEAIGLGDDFAKVQKAVVKLRDNLLRTT
jgi:hypothetical protein